MAEVEFQIPTGCDELEMWFSSDQDGATKWDSECGQNYWMRFTLNDLDIRKAATRAASSLGGAGDAFDCVVESVPEVERMTLRRNLTNPTGYPRSETPMSQIPGKGTKKLWSTPESGIPIPKGATVAFDLVYFVGGHKQTDDNQGCWYVAD
jgi:hypothetical protein